MLYDQSDKPLPNAYRNFKRLEVLMALKKTETSRLLTGKEWRCTDMYFDLPNYGNLSQAEIGKEMGMHREAVQRSISNALYKMEREGLL